MIRIYQLCLHTPPSFFSHISCRIFYGSTYFLIIFITHGYMQPLRLYSVGMWRELHVIWYWGHWYRGCLVRKMFRPQTTWVSGPLGIAVVETQGASISGLVTMSTCLLVFLYISLCLWLSKHPPVYRTLLLPFLTSYCGVTCGAMLASLCIFIRGSLILEEQGSSYNYSFLHHRSHKFPSLKEIFSSLHKISSRSRLFLTFSPNGCFYHTLFFRWIILVLPSQVHIFLALI